MAKQEPRPIAGKVAAITGAARGIGQATAQALARQGARVAIGDLDGELAERAAAELGGGARGYRLDVTDRASFERFLDEVEGDLGPLDVLINNAGIMQLSNLVDEDDATAIRQVDINLHGVITGTKLAIARMQPRGRGHIVNIASSAGKAGVAGGATYSATKHAVVGLSEAVREELRGTGVEVSVVMPGPVNTELFSGAKGTRAVKINEPDDVAAAIVETLRTPRFDVFVPKSLGWVLRASAMLPRSVTDRIGRAMGADRILRDLDTARRAAYERRASRSEPRLEVPPDQQVSPPERAGEPVESPEPVESAG